tara:strand:- start:1046 stop:1324 length:279 start_codon:yes stop_codon:yes gene_type:complete
MKSVWNRLPLVLVGLFAISCVSRSDLDEMKATQKQILTKLDELAKRPAAAPARPRRPRGPDPKKTYAFPVGKSPTKGPKDALVTIIEVSDFQ